MPESENALNPFHNPVAINPVSGEAAAPAIPDVDMPGVSSEVPAASGRSRLANAAIIAAAGGSLIFEQSPANEFLRTNVALNVLENTGNALAVGGSVAAMTVAIELVPSGLISLGLHREGGAVQKLKDRLVKKNIEKAETEPKEDSKVGKLATAGADVAVALGLGAGLVTIKKHIEDPEPTLAKDLKNSAKATGVVAGVSGVIGYLVGGGLQQAEKVGLETPAEYIVDYGTDTKFWMGALAVGYGAYFAKKGINRFRKSRNEAVA